jgi:hypothetical protein
MVLRYSAPQASAVVKAGDLVEVEISSIGVLRNPVAAETA